MPRYPELSQPFGEGVLRGMEQAGKRSKRAEVTEALARELRRRRLRELIAEYEQAKGTISAKELAAIQAETVSDTLFARPRAGGPAALAWRISFCSADGGERPLARRGVEAEPSSV